MSTFDGTPWKDLRHYYKSQLAHLETPEFVRWFEGWYGDESGYPPEGSALLEEYWSERRFALLGWHAATLPVNVATDRMAFIRSIKEKQ